MVERRGVYREHNIKLDLQYVGFRVWTGLLRLGIGTDGGHL